VKKLLFGTEPDNDHQPNKIQEYICTVGVCCHLFYAISIWAIYHRMIREKSVFKTLFNKFEPSLMSSTKRCRN
jgi:hypothetical protein